MAHCPFKVGEEVSHNDMRKAYGVGNMGGMRWSKTYNCLVIVSDNTKGLYEDKWYGDVLHYTGMGKKGDQKLISQNKRVYEARTTGVEIHLFEVLKDNEYTYRGIVELVEDPYQDTQTDEDKKLRKVWVFPIKPVDGMPAVDASSIEKSEKKRAAEVEKMSFEDLKNAAKSRSKKKPGKRRVTTTSVTRDPIVAEYVKRVAKGVCMLCGNPAPFNDKKGDPYLESHHIKWLSKGGEDSPENAVALCPNCHKRMHVVNDKKDVKKLKAIALKNAPV